MSSCASEQRCPDALVTGGGLICCSVALRLAQAKLQVCVRGRARLDFSGRHFVLAAGCWSSELVKPLGITVPMQRCREQMPEF